MDWRILPFKLSGEFGRASEGLALNVGMDGYAIVEPASPITHILTQRANVCAGFALLPHDSNGNTGLAHMFSDPVHALYGEERVRSHVRRGCEIFTRALQPSGAYTAVYFGGRAFETDIGREQRAGLASRWMGDTVVDFISALPFVKETHDFRYRHSPHDCIISRPSRELVIGRTSDHILSHKNVGQLQKAGCGSPLFDSLSITSF